MALFFCFVFDRGKVRYLLKQKVKKHFSLRRSTGSFWRVWFVLMSGTSFLPKHIARFRHVRFFRATSRRLTSVNVAPLNDGDSGKTESLKDLIDDLTGNVVHAPRNKKINALVFRISKAASVRSLQSVIS